MNVFIVVANAVLIALTLVVIWYARKTVTESNKAAQAARDTVSAVENLLTIARNTATFSEEAAEAARQTVDAARELVTATRQTIEIAKAAWAADERALLKRRLRDIGELAEAAFWKAAAEDGRQPLGGWRCVEQQYIAVALVGVDVDLPRCHSLAGSSQAHAVMAYASDARDEIAAKLRELR